MKNKRILVFAAFIALALLGGATWSAVAQDDEGVAAADMIPAVQEAVQAVNQSFPGIGTIVFPCDAALPIGGPLPPGREPFTPATPAEAVITAFLRTFPERGFPERFELVILEAATDVSLVHCPSLAGDMVDASVVPYRVTLYSAGVPYVYYVSADSSIVIACDL